MNIDKRNAEVLNKWRDGEPWAVIASSMGITATEAQTIISVLTTGKERDERRAERVSKSTRQYTDELLTEMMITCADEIGRSPGSAAFDKWAGKYLAQLVIWRFGTWSKGLERAGLKANEPLANGMGEQKYSEAEVLAAYKRIREAVGKPPGCRQWQQNVCKGEPHEGGIRRRYGGWMDFKRHMEGIIEGEMVKGRLG